MHEFIHAIGFYHEQARTDRDDYVEILYENVKNGKNNRQFDIAEGSNTFGTPYDGFSIMHYGRKDFSKNKKDTIRSIVNIFLLISYLTNAQNFSVLKICLNIFEISIDF